MTFRIAGFLLPLALACAPALACGPVLIDVGHSPGSPGATSARGKSEYEFNKRLADELFHAIRIRPGLTVSYLNGGRSVALQARARSVAASRTGLMLSIHHDSVQEQYLEPWVFEGRKLSYSDRFGGYSLFVSARAPAYEKSRSLGLFVGAELNGAGFRPSLHHAEPIKGENRPLLDRNKGLYRYDGLAVLGNARIPAVLIEGGVIVNRDEEEALNDPRRRARMVSAIVEGVVLFCQSEGW